MILKKIIASLVAFTFIFSNLVFADAPKTNIKGDTKKQQEIVTDPEKIVIPRDFGLVKTKFTGKDKRLIIHIQDAHCNYEAQTNITKILEALIKNDGLSFISVEGADGFIDTSWFKAFPDADIRKEVADYFMKKGEITGPEFLSITTDYPIKLFGAETRSYYIENLNAFTSSYALKEDTEKYYNQIKTAINRLKNYIYNEDLKTFDAKINDYEAKKIQFNDYVRFLQSMAENNRINLRGYNDFFKLVSVLIYEKKIDFSLTDKERGLLIDELSKKLAKETLTELVAQSLAFKVNKISSAEYYSYLKALAKKNNIELSTRFLNLYNYIIYNSIYSKIENEKLFKDIKDVEAAIKEKLFQNDDQKTLERLSRNIDTLLGLVNIKLLNGDYEYYKERKDEFSHEVFADFINKKSAQYGLAYDVEPPTEAIANNVPKLEDFYSIAIKRDKALVDNTLDAMKKEKQQIAVLVTGGFHSEGIAQVLEKQGISYMVVCPTITKDVPSPYIQILTNQRTPFEDILAGGTEAKQAMLAPIPVTWLIGTLNEKELRKLYKEVKGTYLEGRAPHVRDGWLSAHLEVWLAARRLQSARRSDRLARNEAVWRGAYEIAAADALKRLIKTNKLNRTEANDITEKVEEMLKSDEFNDAFHDAFQRVFPARDANADRGKKGPTDIGLRNKDINEALAMSSSQGKLIEVYRGGDFKRETNPLHGALISLLRKVLEDMPDEDFHRAFIREDGRVKSGISTNDGLEPYLHKQVYLDELLGKDVPDEEKLGILFAGFEDDRIGIVMTDLGSNYGHFSVKRHNLYIPTGLINRLIDLDKDGYLKNFALSQPGRSPTLKINDIPLSIRMALEDIMHELIEYTIAKKFLRGYVEDEGAPVRPRAKDLADMIAKEEMHSSRVIEDDLMGHLMAQYAGRPFSGSTERFKDHVFLKMFLNLFDDELDNSSENFRRKSLPLSSISRGDAYSSPANFALYTAAMIKDLAREIPELEVLIKQYRDKYKDMTTADKKRFADEIDALIIKRYNTKIAERAAGFKSEELTEENVVTELPNLDEFRKMPEYSKYLALARYFSFIHPETRGLIRLYAGKASRLLGPNADPKLSYFALDIYSSAKEHRKFVPRGDTLIHTSMGTRLAVQEWLDIEEGLEAYKPQLAGTNSIIEGRKSILLQTPNIIIINTENCISIIQEIFKNNFYGYSPDLTVFVMQTAYHGFDIQDGIPVIDKDSTLTVGGHGDATLQSVQTNRAFWIDRNGYVHRIEGNNAIGYLKEKTEGRLSILTENRVNDMIKLGYNEVDYTGRTIAQVDMDVFAHTLYQMGVTATEIDEALSNDEGLDNLLRNLNDLKSGKNSVLEQVLPSKEEGRTPKGSSPVRVREDSKEFLIETLAQSPGVRNLVTRDGVPFNRFFVSYKTALLDGPIKKEGLPVYARFRPEGGGLIYPETVTCDFTMLSDANAGWSFQPGRHITDFKNESMLDTGIAAARGQDENKKFAEYVYQLIAPNPREGEGREVEILLRMREADVLDRVRVGVEAIADSLSAPESLDFTVTRQSSSGTVASDSILQGRVDLFVRSVISEGIAPQLGYKLSVRDYNQSSTIEQRYKLIGLLQALDEARTNKNSYNISSIEGFIEVMGPATQPFAGQYNIAKESHEAGKRLLERENIQVNANKLLTAVEIASPATRAISSLESSGFQRMTNASGLWIKIDRNKIIQILTEFKIPTVLHEDIIDAIEKGMALDISPVGSYEKGYVLKGDSLDRNIWVRVSTERSPIVFQKSLLKDLPWQSALVSKVPAELKEAYEALTRGLGEYNIGPVRSSDKEVVVLVDSRKDGRGIKLPTAIALAKEDNKGYSIKLVTETETLIFRDNGIPIVTQADLLAAIPRFVEAFEKYTTSTSKRRSSSGEEIENALEVARMQQINKSLAELIKNAKTVQDLEDLNAKITASPVESYLASPLLFISIEEAYSRISKTQSELQSQLNAGYLKEEGYSILNGQLLEQIEKLKEATNVLINRLYYHKFAIPALSSPEFVAAFRGLIATVFPQQQATIFTRLPMIASATLPTEEELIKESIEATPQELREAPIPGMVKNPETNQWELPEGSFIWRITKADVERLNLKKWRNDYKKEAKVSTAGIRGRANIVFPWDTRFPINMYGIALATLGKTLYARETYGPEADLHKLAGSEVRYNSRLFTELIARIQAANGITTHIAPNYRTYSIWMASFLSYKLGMLGGEYVTSSHAISTFNATKDINSEGSQYLPAESMQFVNKIDEILEAIDEKEYYDILVSARDDKHIDTTLFEKIQNGIPLYVKYLKAGVATPQNLGRIKGMKNEIIIEASSGCMYGMMNPIFARLGILSKYGWSNIEENPYFNGVGKTHVNPKTGADKYSDLTADTSIMDVDSEGFVHLPVTETMGYVEKLKDKPLGTTILLTDLDGDRLITAQIESSDRIPELKRLGIAYMPLDYKRVLAVYTPNQSFLMTMAYQKQGLIEAGEWEKYNWFIIKTTPSALSWEEWAQANNIPVVNVPVGFKEIAAIMRKVEARMKEQPGEDVIVEDVFGNEINLGKNPRLLFAGEESGGEIFGPTKLIESEVDRQAVAMREKSAGEAIIITSALIGYAESNGQSLSQYLNEIFERPAPGKHNIVARFDTRKDVKYFDENEPNPDKLKEQIEQGLETRTQNDIFFLGLAVGLKEGAIKDFGKVKAFLTKTFNMSFKELESIEFVGDGTYLRFKWGYVEIRPSGTEAKNKAYAAGPSKQELVPYCEALGNYSGDRTDDYYNLGIPGEWFNFNEKEGFYEVKVRALALYDKYYNKGLPAFAYTPHVPTGKGRKSSSGQAVELELPVSYTVDAETEARIPEIIKTMTTQTGLWQNFFDAGKIMLGWMNLNTWRARDNIMGPMQDFANEVRAEKAKGKTTDIVFVGQGGSIEGIKTLYRTLGADKNSPKVHTMDTIDEEVISELKKLPLETTRFVILSKSMTTMEVHSFYKLFYDLYVERKIANPKNHFTLVTDQGKAKVENGVLSVVDTVREPFRQEVLDRGFYNVFYIEPRSGGRYSWDTAIGILPSLIMGQDTEGILEGARLVEESAKNTNLEENPMAQYGVFKADMHAEGRNRPTLMLPPELKAYGPWDGQLDTESLGKTPEKSSLTIDHEEFAEDTSVYTNKRFFVRIKLGDNDHRLDNQVQKLKESGLPVITIVLPNSSVNNVSPKDVGALLKMSEFATVIAGYLMGETTKEINPVNQKGVEEYKNAQEIYLKNPYVENPAYVVTSETGNLKLDYRASVENAGKITEEKLTEILARLGRTDKNDVAARYAALLYLAAKEKARDYAVMTIFKRLSLNPDLEDYLNEWRYGVRSALKIDTLGEEAPCILHAKQQGFQMGENSGFFTVVRFTEYKGEKTVIPGSLERYGEPKTFEDLIKAQAIGALQALSNATMTAENGEEVPVNRLGAMIELKDESPESVAEFGEVIREAVSLVNKIIDEAKPTPAPTTEKGKIATAKSEAPKKQVFQGPEAMAKLNSAIEAGMPVTVKGYNGPAEKALAEARSRIINGGWINIGPEGGIVYGGYTETESAYTPVVITNSEVLRPSAQNNLARRSASGIMPEDDFISEIMSKVKLTGKNADEIFRIMELEARGLYNTLGTVGFAGTANVEIILLSDTKVVPSDIAKEGEVKIQTYVGGLTEVRGTGRTLVEAGINKLAELTKANTTPGKRFIVVAITEDSTLGQIKEDEKAVLGKILNIKNEDGRYIPVIGLYDLAIRLAYEIYDEGTRQRLEAISNNEFNEPFTIDYLKNKVITILPKIGPVNTSEAIEAYNAAQAVLRSL